jgi:DegV family protein with EDD domain
VQGKSVKIVTDSTNDLTEELLKRYDVDVIPLYAVLEEKSYRDGVDIDTLKLLAWCDANKSTPKTAAAAEIDFLNLFKLYVGQGREIVYIGISSEISSTVQNARLAAREFPDGKIEVVDSRNLSTGIGYLVLEAAAMAEQGMNAQEIRVALEQMIPRINVSFVINTLTYLYRGGRCTALQFLGANMLSLKPEIIVQDGKMTTRRKYRGSLVKALEHYVKDHMAEINTIDPRRILVTHSPMDKNLVDQICEQIRELGYFKEVLPTEAGCVICSHCGGNTLGVIYMNK